MMGAKSISGQNDSEIKVILKNKKLGSKEMAKTIGGRKQSVEEKPSAFIRVLMGKEKGGIISHVLWGLQREEKLGR
jgi:hypothetical protein